MRILQLIDSLEAGGGEKMAVSYANALVKEIEFSGLVATRKEGPLLHQINEKVSYLFLKKKKVIDIKALFQLRNYIKKNKVAIVHAHSTSFFLAFLLKISSPYLKIIWHNHYGNSEFSSVKRLFSLKMAIPFFYGVIAVNQKLKIWAEQKLGCKNVIYLPNFPSNETDVTSHAILQGIDGKRILSLANLRDHKNHFLLLEVAQKLMHSHPEWTFHLVGKDFEDEYSRKIKDLILEYNLENNVFLYGSKQDVAFILKQSAIAVLTSKTEGLPVALLEYGLYKKPVVVTAVGEIPFIIQNKINGLVVPSQNGPLFYEALVSCVDDTEFRNELGNRLFETVIENFSEEAIIRNYMDWLQTI